MSNPNIVQKIIGIHQDNQNNNLGFNERCGINNGVSIEARTFINGGNLSTPSQANLTQNNTYGLGVIGDANGGPAQQLQYNPTY